MLTTVLSDVSVVGGSFSTREATTLEEDEVKSIEFPLRDLGHTMVSSQAVKLVLKTVEESMKRAMKKNTVSTTNTMSMKQKHDTFSAAPRNTYPWLRRLKPPDFLSPVFIVSLFTLCATDKPSKKASNTYWKKKKEKKKKKKKRGQLTEENKKKYKKTENR